MAGVAGPTTRNSGWTRSPRRARRNCFMRCSATIWDSGRSRSSSSGAHRATRASSRGAGGEELLDALLGDDLGLGPLKELLIRRTQGNPFFLEESVRTLVETKVLEGERGGFRLAPPVYAVQVPRTV